ncbi:L-threonylcarbamoyladenylate synthase [Auraticoccus monumenti]|uniref:L-threonylcarbamoyladenylate synthase n=1 Tax=Auraticoccus monumenti TaxID=675864 RepID=A0A1G7AZ74_9ACTN|nr:L-threonylcarbamoyladenylate synthase [Auraticoccus monumenti]SDE19315.1 tRNA threonylcarbamoyl adenosine modification protein, Sua5/YciO/YrdC/YwlC family [Auraticoccus monumenti]
MSEQGSADVVDDQTYERFDCTGDELPRGAAAAREAVNRGECVVLPTDTVYGIGADAFSAEAVQRLLDAKGRGRDMPPPVLIADPRVLKALATDVPTQADQLVARHWPGPLTVICKAQRSLQMDLGDTEGTIALRVPDHDVARTLLRRTGPLAVSSANRSGQPAATDVDSAVEQLGGRVRVYLDAGPTPGPVASSIVDFTQSDEGVLVREGVLSLEVLQETLPGLLVSDTVAAQRQAAAAAAASTGDSSPEDSSPEGSGTDQAQTGTTGAEAGDVAATGGPDDPLPPEGTTGMATDDGGPTDDAEPTDDAGSAGTTGADGSRVAARAMTATEEPDAGAATEVVPSDGTEVATTGEGTQVVTAGSGSEVVTGEGTRTLTTGAGTEVITSGAAPTDTPEAGTEAAGPAPVPAESVVVTTGPDGDSVEVEHGSQETEVVAPVRVDAPEATGDEDGRDEAGTEHRGRAPDA